MIRLLRGENSIDIGKCLAIIRRLVPGLAAVPVLDDRFGKRFAFELDRFEGFFLRIVDTFGNFADQSFGEKNSFKFILVRTFR
jgi:hypothetical protein